MSASKNTPKTPSATLSVGTENLFVCTRKILLAKHIEKFCGQTINNRGKTKLHNHPAKNLLELDVAAGRTDMLFPKDILQDRSPRVPGFSYKGFWLYGQQ
jgi:hypothetical protein